MYYKKKKKLKIIKYVYYTFFYLKIFMLLEFINSFNYKIKKHFRI